MTLQEAVKQADAHLANRGTFLQGEAGNCFTCPVARYLSRLMDNRTSVKVYYTHVDAVDVDGVEQTMDLTPGLRHWISVYDSEND